MSDSNDRWDEIFPAEDLNIDIDYNEEDVAHAIFSKNEIDAWNNFFDYQN